MVWRRTHACRDIVREVMTDAQEVARANGVSLLGGITNRFLLNAEAYHRFCRCGISDYQILFDGPPELHDTTRSGERAGQLRHDLEQPARYQADGSRWRNPAAHSSHQAECRADLQVAERIKRTFNEIRASASIVRPVENLGGPNDLRELVIPVSARSPGHRAELPSEHERPHRERN